MEFSERYTSFTFEKLSLPLQVVLLQGLIKKYLALAVFKRCLFSVNYDLKILI